MKRKILFLITIICLFCPFFLTSCDSFVDVKGKAYLLENPTDNIAGQILNNESLSTDYILQPISDVTISFYIREKSFSRPSINGKYDPIYDPSGLKHQAIITSDASGSFTGFWVVGAGLGYIKVTAEKDGFYPVEQIFTFDGGKPG